MSFHAITPQAQAALSVSKDEKAVFAYFATKGVAPNYSRWVRQSTPYQQAQGSNELQRTILHEETVRLKWGFGNYNPNSDFIEITTSAKADIKTIKGARYLALRLPKTEIGVPFFPFPYGLDWISLIIKEIKSVTYLSLPDDRLKQISQRTAPGQSIPVILRLRARPLRAETKPIELDHMHFYPLHCDMAFLELTDAKSGEILYSFSADWYLSDSQNEILDILMSRDE